MQRKPLPFISILFVLHILLLLFKTGYTFENPASEERIIFPGQGIDSLLIGEFMPAKLPSLLDENIKAKKIEIETKIRGGKEKQKVIERIIVLSPDFYIAGSQFRIKHNTLGDILNYYGKGEPQSRSDKFIISFPTEGIDFEIDPRDEVIVSISVYTASRSKIHREKSDFFKEQFKMIK